MLLAALQTQIKRLAATAQMCVYAPPPHHCSCCNPAAHLCRDLLQHQLRAAKPGHSPGDCDGAHAVRGSQGGGC